MQEHIANVSHIPKRESRPSPQNMVSLKIMSTVYTNTPIPSTGWWSFSPRNGNELGYSFLFSYTHLTIIYYHTKLVSSIVLSRYILICYQYRHQNIHTHKMYHCRRSWRLNPTNHHFWCSNFSKPPFFFGIFHEITMFTVESSHISSALTHTKHAIEMTRLLHLARDDDATGQAAIVGLSLGMCIIHVI